MNIQSITRKLSVRPRPLKYTVLGWGAAGWGIYGLL